MWVRLLTCFVAAVAGTFGSAAGQGAQEFRVDPTASTVVVHVGRAGLFAVASHNHEVAAAALQGSIMLTADLSRSRVTLQFDAAAMKVTGRGEPARDVAEVQRVMLSDRVLDVQRYPTISFSSRRITVLHEESDRLMVRIEGDLTLHGSTRPLSVPAEVRLSSNQIVASGTATIRQTDFGIRPVTAGAGMVRVKNEVTIVFSIVCRPL